MQQSLPEGTLHIMGIHVSLRRCTDAPLLLALAKALNTALVAFDSEVNPATQPGGSWFVY